MQRAIDLFKYNIESVLKLDVLYLFIEDKNVKAIDPNEILRSEIVLAVSALDTFISDLLYYGIVQVFEGSRELSPDQMKPFNTFNIDMETLKKIIQAENEDIKKEILGSYIKKFNSKNAFQDPKQIESALNILGIRNLWVKIGEKISESGEDVKKELANITWQRHKIAHESDIDPVTLLKRDRDRESTLVAIQFIKKICDSIYELLIIQNAD